MDKPEGSVTAEHPHDPDVLDDLPPGNHPLEIAARRGFGPLSPLTREVWHGGAVPCVSCGQLVQRNVRECEHCGQNLSRQMIEKMRVHAGPWYVLEHVRPFPGVSLERIIRQIRRGLLTETSIVRGPTTYHQWRFAVETPGLCRYFSRCWNCHAEVTPSDSFCQSCLSYLSFEKPGSTPGAPPVTTAIPSPSDSGPERKQRVPLQGPRRKPAGGTGKPQPARAVAGGDTTGGLSSPAPTGRVALHARSDDLDMLRAALDEAPPQRYDDAPEAAPYFAGIRATWIAIAMLLAVIAALLWFTQQRTRHTTPTRPATPGIVLPVAQWF